jgi:hypothetical protein
MNVTPGGSSSSSSSRVSFAAHTYRGGIGDWLKLRAADLSNGDTQVADLITVLRLFLFM